jgi:hypothetical protein
MRMLSLPTWMVSMPISSLDACAGHCPRCSSMRHSITETTTSDWIWRAICGRSGCRTWPGCVGIACRPATFRHRVTLYRWRLALGRCHIRQVCPPWRLRSAAVIRHCEKVLPSLFRYSVSAPSSMAFLSRSFTLLLSVISLAKFLAAIMSSSDLQFGLSGGKSTLRFFHFLGSPPIADRRSHQESSIHATSNTAP